MTKLDTVSTTFKYLQKAVRNSTASCVKVKVKGVVIKLLIYEQHMFETYNEFVNLTRVATS